MPKRSKISMSVIRRLPRYYRFLSDLLEKDITRISSGELSKLTGLTASQIRQDLNCFGGFGQQGYGYDVARLYAEMGNILGVGNDYTAILVGCGNLGRAVAIHLLGSQNSAFRLTAAFDKNPMLVGASLHGLHVFDSEQLGDYCTEQKPDAAFLCLPADGTAPVVDLLYSHGVRTFWNFSHFDIAMRYPDAIVENVHLTDSLLTLCYRISNDTSAEENNSLD